MKKMLLLLLVMISYLHVCNAQGIVFVTTVFRNTTTNPCTITVQIGLQNKTGSAVDVTHVNFGMQWGQDLTYISSHFIPAGGGLDAPDFYGTEPDNGLPTETTIGTRTTTQGDYKTFDYVRSTNLCSSMITVPPGMIVPFFFATFHMDCAVSNDYCFIYNNCQAQNSTWLNNDRYIVEFIGANDNPSNAFKKILFVTSVSQSLSDQSGNKCNPDGTIKNVNTLTNQPGNNVYVNSNGAILPVELDAFEANAANGKTELNWTTQTELLNKGFEVQKKVNGEFKTIAFVFSQAEGGYSNMPLQYSYRDAAALPGETVFYRLKLVSELGTESFSEIRHVKLANPLQVRVYPNPSAGWVNIAMPDDASQYDIMITDFTGRVFRSYNHLRNPLLRITDLRRGFYHVIVTNRNTGERLVEKLIVQ